MHLNSSVTLDFKFPCDFQAPPGNRLPPHCLFASRRYISMSDDGFRTRKKKICLA